MDPQVRYARSADGAHIAYCEVGEGYPLVIMPAMPLSHVQLEWGITDLRRLYERLISAGHRLIRYDGRGLGLSDRDVDDFSLTAQLSDMDAVVGALGVDRFALYGSGDQGMVAAAWAALHPERVSHLVLWCSWASRARVSDQAATRALRALLEQDWLIYTETAARVLFGWSSEDRIAREFAAFLRQCTDPEVLARAVPQIYEWDVTDMLPRIQCPTLVLMRKDIATLPVDISREMARDIPDARLVVLEGSSPLPFAEDSNSFLREVTGFLGSSVGELAEVRGTGDAPVTILFTDMEGSTALTQQLGDEAAQSILRVHDRIVRNALASHGGTEIKHTGDGLMASFPSATRAVEAAIAIQRGLASMGDEQLSVRVGLNAGEPVAEHGDFFGTTVQLAARICDRAAPGSILVSAVVRDLAAGKGLQFSDDGEAELKGFSERVRLYEVNWKD